VPPEAVEQFRALMERDMQRHGLQGAAITPPADAAPPLPPPRRGCQPPALPGCC
jgi:hypothetical protein